MTITNGTIKRIIDKGFRLIATAEGVEYFFHQSACATRPSTICGKARPCHSP
jgi:hypothetical protein